MNVQHEELIKNLDKKLEDYQNKNGDQSFRYYELRKLSEKLGNLTFSSAFPLMAKFAIMEED